MIDLLPQTEKCVLVIVPEQSNMKTIPPCIAGANKEKIYKALFAILNIGFEARSDYTQTKQYYVSLIEPLSGKIIRRPRKETSSFYLIN